MATGVDLAGLRSGDVVLYWGQHPLQRLQQELTSCPWGQVGLILRLPGESEPLVFESSKVSRVPDVRLGAVVRGVQLVRFAERVASFEGKVAVRALHPRLPQELERMLLAFADRVHGRPFNNSKWAALRSLRRRNLPSRDPGFFCSELVAEAYQAIGLLPRPPQGLSSNNYIPADFSSCFEARILRLQAGFEFGKEEEWT
jgi:hypothetical protein